MGNMFDVREREAVSGCCAWTNGGLEQNGARVRVANESGTELSQWLGLDRETDTSTVSGTILTALLVRDSTDDGQCAE